MYKVVEFDDGIMAVPTKWVDVKKSICKWPYESKEIEEAIKDNEDVGRGWSELPIRTFFGKAVDNLASAKEKVKLALIVSDCDDDEKLKRTRHERSRRKIESESRKEVEGKSNRIDSSESDSQDDNTDEDDTSDNTEVILMEKNAPSANKKLSKKLPTNMSLIVQSSAEKMENTSANKNVPIFEQEFIPETHVITQTAAKNSTGKCTKDAKKQYGTTLDEKLDYIIGLLEENTKKNNTILADLGSILKHISKDEKKNGHESNAKSQSESAKNVYSFIPLKDANDLDLLEEQLKAEDFKNAMINALMKRGGKNVEDLTNNIMTKVFTNELASNFSMQGKQKKKALKRLIEAIMACENSKEDYIHKQMGKWLANAPVRLSRNRAKKEKSEAA